MKKSALGKELMEDIKRSTKWATILWGITVMFIMVFVFSAYKNEAITIMTIMCSFLMCGFAIPASIVGYELPSRLRARKMIGKNAYIQMDENYIKVFDKVKGMDIKKEFKWTDIEYIHFKAYNTDMRAKKRYYGLLFVADKERFYNAMSMRKRCRDFKQRQEEMSAGFFIGCDRHMVKHIEQLWGKEIR